MTLVDRQSRSLVDRYVEVRGTTEELAAPLSAEDQTVQTMPDVSPTKWHRAHVTWFFETFLLTPSLRGYAEYDPAYGYLFNSYYETVGRRHPRPERGHLSRPGVEQIASYRAHADRAMLDLLASELEPATEDLVRLGLNHEQQHQELLLMDIKHVLSCNPLRPSYSADPVPRPITLEGEPSSDWRASGGPPPRTRGGMSVNTASSVVRPPAGGGSSWAEFPGGLVTIGNTGCSGAGGEFCFDNEGPVHSTYLEPFALARTPVTCADWLAFMDDGGYGRADLWLSEGWAAVNAGSWSCPGYWSRAGDAWELFTLNGPRPVDPAEPVCHVSYYEADAFARWAGARLPTEFEWESVAVDQPVRGNFMDSHLFHPTSGPPGPSMPNGSSEPEPCRAGSGEVTKMFGDVWEWTASPYVPYPRFSPAPGAVGEYNGKFMVNQQVLRGGSCVTPPGHIRATYRNFFPASARWAFSGLRLARYL